MTFGSHIENAFIKGSAKSFFKEAGHITLDCGCRDEYDCPHQ